MWSRIKNAWFALFGGGESKAALRKELTDVYKKYLDVRRQLGRREVELIRLPTDETMYQYREVLTQFVGNPWIRAFFVLRERELLKKFKDGGDSEVLRGALVCIDDLITALEDEARNFETMKEAAAA